ncbi:hypothetical protein [Dyadobacter sp. Leaf189]|uniref:hypothetical protein n=1 Tax=Dyadobacter sp. Leaf189 TaxID=1736295 RepID=UPI0006F24A4B|nr:hypothetical protein [Dyadobacter sp. Leaf189]KQS32816.1 hypothetical protein ASG33_01540 [Dyadobacter sp. Leaf189]
MKKAVYILMVTMLVAACNSSNRIEQTSELKSEMKSVEIKRVTNTQLVYSANEWGKKIAQITEKSLQKELEKDPAKGKQLCGALDQIPVVAALQKEYGVKIELLGASDLNNSKLDPKERELLGAYLYSAKNKANAGDNLQRLGDTLMVYNAPVATESLVCKSCADNPDQPFAVWRLLFNKKDIIRKLDAKQLKK